MGRVIVITSGKGGVGKTTTTANVGTGLAMLGKKVVMVDTDIGLRNLDVVLGLENRIVYDIVDAVRGLGYGKIRMEHGQGLDTAPGAHIGGDVAPAAEKPVKPRVAEKAPEIGLIRHHDGDLGLFIQLRHIFGP